MTEQSKAFYLSSLGLVTGLLSATLGIGGGVIVVPSLRTWFSFSNKAAVYLSLVTIVPVSLYGVIGHYLVKPDNILWLPTLYLVIGSILGTKMGVKIFHLVNEKILRYLFILILAYSAAKMTPLWELLPVTADIDYLYPKFYYFILFGIVAGAFSSIFGVGGGVVIVPVLSQLFGHSINEAIASSLLFILPTSLLGLWFHRGGQKIEKSIIIPLAISPILGTIVGAFLVNYMPASFLKNLFAVVQIYFAVKLLRLQENK